MYVIIGACHMNQTTSEEQASMNTKDNRRKYPPFFEKMVPIMLGVIGVLVVLLLVIIFGVALGLL